MGRTPCCDRQGLKKGPWTPEEDKLLVDYIQTHGHGIWRSLPKQAGLLRGGKSCRLRWINYLRPDIKRGPFSPEEQNAIVHLHGLFGNKWASIAAQLPGRTDNEVKNHWNTHLKKRLTRGGAKAEAYVPSSARSDNSGCGGARFSSAARRMAQWESARLEAEARLAGEPLIPEHSHAEAEPDVFVRIWHSEVGQAFRSRDCVSCTGASPASSSTKRCSFVQKRTERAGPESSVSASGGHGGDAEALERGVAAADSPSSKGSVGEKTTEEAYQAYVDMAGEDTSLGNLLQESFGSFGWWCGDLGMEGYLDQMLLPSNESLRNTICSIAGHSTTINRSDGA